ncbi:MAG: YqjF family protein [Actinomycetota bacterium]
MAAFILVTDAVHPHPRETVRWPMLRQRWATFAAVHWPYEPLTVQSLLPDPLVVESFEGSAWVSLTPFVMEGMRPPIAPAMPWLSTYPEANVRTYARHPSGRDGLWFFSLDVGRLAVALTGRAMFRLPYMWAGMEVTREAGVIRYGAQRRWGGPGGSFDLAVSEGQALGADAGPLDHFLTARWGSFSTGPLRMTYTPVEHQPWPLRRASVERLDQSLVEAAGLPSPTRDPVVHVSPGVDVKLGFPQPI